MPRRFIPAVVAIVGGSASGKTTLARDLVDQLAPDAALISLDRFYLDLGHLPPAVRARVNFDRPARIDWPLFGQTLDTLLRGRSAPLPLYDFGTHTRASGTQLQAPVRFLVLDGLWLLRRAEILSRCTLRLFVACPSRERLRRRLLRDVLERGRDRAEVLRRWTVFVEPGFRRFVAPQAVRADLVVRSPISPGVVNELVRRLRDRSESPPTSGSRLPPRPFPRAASGGEVYGARRRRRP